MYESDELLSDPLVSEAAEGAADKQVGGHDADCACSDCCNAVQAPVHAPGCQCSDCVGHSHTHHHHDHSHHHGHGHTHGHGNVHFLPAPENEAQAFAQSLVSGTQFQTRLVVEDEDAPATIDTPYQIGADGQFDGEINQSGDVDYIAVELTAGFRYLIDVPDDQFSNGTLGTPQITGIFDATGESVNSGNISSGPGQSAQLSFSPMETGTYYIAVGSSSDLTGTYSLAIRENGVTQFGDVASDVATTATLEIGAIYEGIIGTNADEDAVRITLEAGISYQIDVLGDSGRDGFTLEDTLLARILDASGSVVFSHSSGDDGIGTDDRVIFTPSETGEYYLIVSSEDARVGSYGVFVTPSENRPVTFSDDIPGGQSGAVELALGGEATGVINSSGDTDFFSIELEAGQAVAVEILRGGDGITEVSDDPEIRSVIGPDGQVVTNLYDDDGGSALNPRLVFTPEESGTYLIQVGGVQGSTGSYRLAANETVGEAPSGQPLGPTNPETFTRTEFVASPNDPLLAPLVFGQRYEAVGPFGQPVEVTYSFTNADSAFAPQFSVNDTTATLNSFWFELSDFEKALARDAFSQIEEFANISFKEVADTGEFAGSIRLGWTTAPNDGTAAFAFLPTGSRTSGDIWFVADNLNRSTETGSFLHSAILHEIGHAIGLTHPFAEEDDPGKPVIANQFDSNRYTVMSYTETRDIAGVVGADLYPQTFMYLDILAIQYIYGAVTAYEGDTVHEFDGADRHYLTLWDTHGNDTLKITNTDEDLILNLREDSWSEIGTTIRFRFGGGGSALEKETLFIPEGIVIENAIGASGDDEILGNDEDNRLIGQAGNDSVFGGFGNDTAFAGAEDNGDDLVIGADGADLIGGGAGADRLFGDAATSSAFRFMRQNSSSLDNQGSDTIFGGSGDDTIVGASWSDANDNGAVDVSEVLDADTQNVLWSGSGDDLVFGGGDADELGGGSGNDTLYGGKGNDVIYGGRENDPVDVNDQIFGGGGDDTVFAGAGDDVVMGDNAADVLFGGAGNDTLNGGAVGDSLFGGAGDDILTGGGGADTFFFASGAGNDQITDFDVSLDILSLANTSAGFSDLSDVFAASVNTISGDVSGVLIDLGGGDTLFLAGISLDQINELNLIL